MRVLNTKTQTLIAKTLIWPRDDGGVQRRFDPGQPQFCVARLQVNPKP